MFVCSSPLCITKVGDRMGVLEGIGSIMGQCWTFLTDTTFTVSGFTFSLANVLEVSVVVGVASLLIGIFITAED